MWENRRIAGQTLQPIDRRPKSFDRAGPRFPDLFFQHKLNRHLHDMRMVVRSRVGLPPLKFIHYQHIRIRKVYHYKLQKFDGCSLIG